MSTVHSTLLNWRAVARISFVGWVIASLVSLLAAWAWFSHALPHHYLQALPRAVAAHAMALIGVQTRTPWLMNFTPTEFLGRLAHAGIDLAPQLEILKSLPLAGFGFVLAGWAVYLTYRRSHHD